MKEKIKKILIWKLILVILLMGAGLFYWFQVRPARIISACDRRAREATIERFEDLVREESSTPFIPEPFYESYYQRCLRQEGFDK